jgi:hypothetical protein
MESRDEKRIEEQGSKFFFLQILKIRLKEGLF